MVILNTRQDADKLIHLEGRTLDKLEHPRSQRVIGVTLSRCVLLELTLMATDDSPCGTGQFRDGADTPTLRHVRCPHNANRLVGL